MSQKEYPQLWDETGKALSWDLLKEGYLVRVDLDSGLGGVDPNLVGFFKGVKKNEDGFRYLALEIPDGINPMTAPAVCKRKEGKFGLTGPYRVTFVEVVSRDGHASHTLFNCIGRLKFELAHLQRRISVASEALG